MRKTLLILGVAVLSSFISITSYAASWKQDNQGWWYQYDDGDYPVNQWMQDGEKWYYFNSSGYMLANQWIQEGNKWYFFDTSGCMVTNQWIGNYYLGADGAMLVNTMTPDGYQVDENGEWIEEQQESKSTLIEITEDNFRDYFDFEKTEEMVVLGHDIYDELSLLVPAKYKMKIHEMNFEGVFRTERKEYKDKVTIPVSHVEHYANPRVLNKGDTLFFFGYLECLYLKTVGFSLDFIYDELLPQAKKANYKFYPSSISGTIEILE